MDNNKRGLQQRQQQFQEQLDALEIELLTLEARVQPSSPNYLQQQWQVLRVQYRLAELYQQNEEYPMAVVYFRKVLDTTTDPAEQPPAVSKLTRTASQGPLQEPAAPIATEPKAKDQFASLRENVMNQLASLYHSLDDPAQAMSCLLDAKRSMRERQQQSSTDESVESATSNAEEAMATKQLEQVLQVNHAMFLHAKGSEDDAIHVLSRVIKSPTEVENSESARIRATALSLRAAIWKAKGSAQKCMELSMEAVQCAERAQDPSLLARCHNNVALLHFENRDVTTALPHFVAAYRASVDAQDIHLQATSKYHIGVAIAVLGDAVDIPQSCRLDPTRYDAVSAATLNEEAEAEVVADAAQANTSARDCFIETESHLASAQDKDAPLSVLAQGCRGEAEYYGGEFHTAEAEFSIALHQLKEFLFVLNSKVGADTSVAAKKSPEANIHKRKMRELDVIQGFLLSYVGCTQLVEGKFDLAESSHQADLALALESEDIHAQQRATRNLAMVYNATQRYEEAVPLWRDSIEIATVMQSQLDLLMSYSGLGTALKELRMTSETAAEHSPELLEMNPLDIFLRQRALAVDLGDRHQQILAQQHIVNVYESPLAAADAIEQRLSECDMLVRLCEQYSNVQYRADAYRALANALTAQVERLSARGPRFAEAVKVLTQKRNVVCEKYQEANTMLTKAAVLLFNNSDPNAEEVAAGPSAVDKHVRQPFMRLEILQRP